MSLNKLIARALDELDIDARAEWSQLSWRHKWEIVLVVLENPAGPSDRIWISEWDQSDAMQEALIAEAKGWRDIGGPLQGNLTIARVLLNACLEAAEYFFDQAQTWRQSCCDPLEDARFAM